MVLLNSLRKGANPWVTIKEDNYWLGESTSSSLLDSEHARSRIGMAI